MNIRIGIITVSDRSSRGERLDAAGPALVDFVTMHGWEVIRSTILADEMAELKNILTSWADSGDLDVILTTGGTGFSPRDITPEATLAVIERSADGIPEAMRAASLRVTPHAMLSRQVAGIRKSTLIVNLPGNPKGAVENLREIAPVLPHAVELLRGDPAAEAGHATTGK
jgi:molybdopterin adenylyltransferase